MTTLLFVAVLSRALQFGNPVIQIDEQFYLLTGDRLLHGALPFVDIWDRKPFGLFALYAAIRILGGSGIIQYQIVATLFAAATACVVAHIALRLANLRGATVAGIVYLLFILSSGGDGGQAPVFYNLPVFAAALLVVRIQERAAFDRRAMLEGCAAMMLLGLAIQLKYSVIFEGAFFGLWLLGVARARGVRLSALIALALLWCSIALTPAVSIAAGYWQGGHIGQFVFANFISIFQRSPTEGLDVPDRLFTIAIHVAAPGAAAAWGLLSIKDRTDPNRRFVAAWSSVAIGAVLGFGTYHNHYALPLFVPLAVAGAPIYGEAASKIGIGWFRFHASHVVMLIGLLLAGGTMMATRAGRGTGSAVYAAAQLVGSATNDCIFVFSGDPILYHLTNSCLPTPYLFPTLLSERRDASSMGTDQMSELRRTMATRPRYVFLREPMLHDAQASAWAFMRRTLSSDYRRADAWKSGSSVTVAYARRPATAGPTTRPGVTP